jgi:hypothetical protein
MITRKYKGRHFINTPDHRLHPAVMLLEGSIRHGTATRERVLATREAYGKQHGGGLMMKEFEGNYFEQEGVSHFLPIASMRDHA